ncbi:PLxRFG domain-containing protein [Acinetobacter bereziniae]|uniref:PLxRFG domain-containing protein n=1 Tax=Acinetobacter bereziniae TaxID=106648 RepID=UPI00190293B9|nr:PLxRFG domain-containing protein [Acinetobacter bereziniae]MBJ8476495.1 PLxRFG domain-containing protein [Acinetobacter bereziniae]
MSESTLKPFTGKLDENIDSKQQSALKPFTGALDGEKKGVTGHLKDIGLSALSGAVAVPELAVGIMDTMSDGAVGKTLENKDGSFGFRPKEAKQAIGNLHTEQYKAQQQEFADAGKDGNWTDKVVDKTKVALKNPSLIANTVVESVPSMLAGAIVGRASGIANPVVAGAVGEGSVMAGSQAEQIRQDTVDGRLTADQSLASATTGVLGGLIGFAGGRIAQKLGIGDVDTMLVNGKLGPAEIAGEVASMPAKSLPRRVIEGAISEGFLEELPQSVSEQILQNLALDKPWSDGVEDAAVMGTLAGMAMGGAANILSGRNNENGEQLNQTQINTPNQPLSPSSLSTGQDSSLTGEYIPRESSQSGTNQNRTAFEYDQPSKDADNLLTNNFQNNDDTGSFGNYDTPNNPESPLSPNGGKYLDSPQLPSERLGINPNDGPMSSAAALAVDSGVTTMHSAPQENSQNEAPLSSAIPSNYQSLLGRNNENFTPIINGLDQSAQPGERNTINDATNNQGTNLGVSSKNDGATQTTEGTGSNTGISVSGVNEATFAAQGQSNSNNINTIGHDSVLSSENEAGATSSSTISTNASDSKSRVVEPIEALEKKIRDAKTVAEKAKIRKDIDELQKKALQTGLNSNDKLQPINESEIRNAETPDSTGSQFTTTSSTSTNDAEIVSKIANTNSQDVKNSVENQEFSKKAEDYTSQVKELEQKLSSEKSVIQKNKIRNQINHLKSEFNNLPLDHGVLNVPLSKRGNIDKQIDQFKAERSKLEKEKNDIKKMDHLDDQNIAKPAYESLTKDDFQNYANRTGIKLSEAKSELKSMSHWQPKKAIKVFEALKNSRNRDKPEKIYTPSNREIEVRNKLVEADQLIASNHGNGAINEKYPQILQPRDRTRPSSQAQVTEIANNLNPKLLGNSPSTANGSPIISNDNIIESGNGRVMAIRKAYEQGKAENYKKWLSEQGYDISKMKNPVLVRERLTELSDQDRIAYTKESNERTTLDLSPTERAIADADKVLNIIEDYFGGDLNSSNNRQFVNKFVTGVVSTNERSSVIGSDKALTQQGKRRIQAALVAAAYGDSAIIDQVFEDSDSEIKSIGNALTDAAGSWALMRKLAQQGSIPSDLDITNNLIEAVHLVHKARNEKRKLIELVAQDDIFEGELDQTTKDFLSIFYRGEKYLQARSREKVADALNYYANQAQKVQPGENLFGDLPKSESDLIRETYERQQNQETDKQQDIFSSSKSNDSNIRKIGTTGQRAITESQNEKTSKQSEVSDKHPTKDNLAQINLQANEAATSPSNNIPEPSQAQIEAGNYKKGHIRFQGLEIAIENPKGSERRGTDPNGKEWAHTMSDHYGYIKKTTGADNEQIDTYVGINPESDQVFIVDQIDQQTGNFDEHKVMLGFDSQEDATKAYQSNFDKGWKVGQIRSMTMEQFKDWLKNGDTSKPSSETEQTNKVIRDLGEKIGGARKDTALSTGKTSKTKITDNRPTWSKRYVISEIVSSTNTEDNGKWVIEDSRKSDWKGNSKRMGTFSSKQEAEQMLPVLAVAQKHRIYARRESEGGFEIWRLINDYKRVKVINQVFETKEDAQKYLVKNAAQILEINTTFGEIDIPRPDNTLRKGVERRKGDVKDTDFMEIFGFRGVEFGNWNNQFERQQLLNDAFDGLLDLADVLNIPPKAISLNGDLALAFGARGQGLSSARAHYEPAKAVINLTKMNGAGSLAHEWWHAFDHYLARQDGKAVAEWTIGKDGTRSLKISSNTKNNMASGGFSYKNSGVRDEVKESYISLIQTMFSKAEEYVEDTQQVDNFVGKAREVVTQKLESIRNDLSKELDPKYYKRFNKPAPTELLTEFDTIAQQISQGEMLTTEWRTDVVNKKPSGIFSGARWTNDGLEKLSQIYKKVRGRSGFNTDQKGVLDQLRSSMNQYSSRLKMLAEAQKGSTKIKKVPTSFVMNAKDLDSGRGSDYWTSPHEMSARAFQGFVEDKIKEQSGESPFLNYAPENAVIETPWGWTRPFPHGSERKAINEKFDNLVAKLKTEETETGIKLYSRGKLKPDEERKGTSPIETTFNALSVVSASRRVLSVLQHLKLSTAQDSSISDRITVGSAGIKGGFNVQVISSFDGLPAEIQKDATYQDDKGNTQNYDVSAVWHDGTLYVVADQVYGDSTKQLTTFDAYEEMLAHEIIGHFGIQQIFGQEYKTKLQQLYNALGKLDGIRKIASNNGVDMAQFESAYIEPYTQGAKDGIYTESDVQQALVGELFAFVAQNAKSRPFVRQKLQEVIGYIRQWFRDRGFDKFLSRYNDSDLMMFLSEARKAVVDRSYFGKYKNQKISTKNDSDTPLYSRSRENKAGSTVKQVRDLLIERFGKDTINELERQGKLEIIQDYSVEGVEGFYYNGKAVLVASNLTNESAIPTFLHELGGHAGFQNMMNQEQYSELMRQFDKLVEQGNPVALAAKLLAQREQGNVRQQLEYLPYLLTLSSTMQQRNVVQRNALQKLIQNIVSYVKAWVFDNFGINLNLNPDDMLALSERMVNQIKQQSSLDTVRQKYQGTSQWMTAPNGEKSNLNEQQWLQVRTPEFKKWFGDWENDAQNSSQILDENGEPKVVYHGTNAEFNEFKKGHGLLGEGIYLTDSFDTADMYTNNRGKNGFVLPLFVNIRSALNTKGNVSRDQVVQATKSGKYQGIVHQFEDQEFIVALESNQVKMAEGNTGTFNSESADIRFSRSAKETIDKLSKKISDLSVKSIKEKSSYKYTDWLGIGLSTLGRRQLTEIYNKLLPQLTKYNDLAAQMDADKNDAGAEADIIVREWANLKDENQLADLMHDATLAKIDPAKPHVKGDSVIKYKQLRADFNALSPEAQAMYIKARDAYKSHYAKVQSAIKERILRASLSSQKKADLIKQMDDQFFGYVIGVYFPLARFGKYVVVARNNLGQVESVSRAETMGEAQKARAEMMKKYPEWKVDRVILDKEFSASRDAAGRGFMSSLFDEVANLGLSPSEMVEFEDTLNQLYLSSMPDLSWAKHGIHRKGTAGFSQDARRAFAQNMFHGAGYLAKLRYGDQLAQQLDDMQKYATEQAKQDSNYDQPSAQRVIDEMNKRHDNLMNPKSHPLSSASTSFGFIYYLGLSPAAAIVNLSQTALMAYPIMGAKWGFDKAANELLKASNDFRKGVDFHKVKWEGTKTDLYKTVSSDISKFLNKDEKQAYDDAVSRGVIDVTQAHDLAGIAQGEDSGIMWKTRPIMRAASVMFHSAERFNREVTFIAAYRLARQAGSNHDSAFDQAVDATYKGHFDYSSGNRPRIMQGNVAKVLLLFKQFGQNMIYTLARQTYQSIKGETDAERKEARKSLGAILAMHATFAGVLGLPMVGMLLSVASWMGGDDDDPWDAEVALRNYLAEAFGPTISNLLMKGAPRAFTPADISSRVGINNLLLPDVQEGLEGKRWAESAMVGALGPVAGIGLNVAKGAQEISEGHNLRGLETMLPVFLKNFAKTYRYGEEGVQDKTGVSIMDEVSSMDLLVQGMGFSPSDVRTANEGKSAIYQLDKKLNARRGRLVALWSRAKMMDDQAEMDNIWNDIENFNEKNPSRRITRVNLNQSYKNRQRRIDRSEDGIYLSRNRQEARSAGYFAFGD